MLHDQRSCQLSGLAESVAEFTHPAAVTPERSRGRGMSALVPAIHGQSVFAIGSAPGASLAGQEAGDRVVTVNGSLAPFVGLVPDFHFINGFTTCARHPLAARSMELLDGRRCRHLVCITRAVSFEAMLEALRAAGFAWEYAHEVTPAERRESNEIELGRPLAGEGGENVASTGVSALCLLRQAGAARIRATGFSLEGGCSYTREVYKRAHIPVDAAIFARPYWREVIGDGCFSPAFAGMLQRAQDMARPVFAAAQDGKLAAVMPVEIGPDGTDERAAYSPLEALGRLLCGLAPLLERARNQPAAERLIDPAPARALVIAATEPGGAGALNFSKGQQPLVDAAFLAQAMLRAPGALWDDLQPGEQDALMRALRRTRRIKPHFNNWLLFSAVIEAAFARFGQPWDRMRVDYALRQHAQWYAGDGSYSDGPHLRCDYYNSYVIQPMLLDILDAVGEADRSWARMIPAVTARAQRQGELLERLIGPDGSFPPLGRSITYRCGAFHLLAQLALRRQLPETLKPAQVRGALAAVIERTLGGAQTYDDAGWLRIGLNGAQPALAERYISTGSLYLCATAFLPLGLPPDDPFWADPDTPWTQAQLWEHGAAPPRDKALDT